MFQAINECVLVYYSKKITEYRGGVINEIDLCSLIRQDAIKELREEISKDVENKFLTYLNNNLIEYYDKNWKLFTITQKGEEYFIEKIRELSDKEKNDFDKKIKEYYEYIEERDSHYALLDRIRMSRSCN